MDFCPSVYEHAARVIGRTPWDVSRDGALLAKGHIEAYRLYRHRPVVVGIDIYDLEAEAYGAAVQRPSGHGIPAIIRFPSSSVDDLLQLRPFDPETAGRVPVILGAAQAVARACPDADVRVPVAGPFSVAANLLGLEELLFAVATQPDRVKAALLHLVQGQIQLCRAIATRGLGIAFFESAAAPPLLSPAQFRAVELPALRVMLQAVTAITGSPPAFIMGGDTTPIVEAIMETGTGYVCCPSETDQQAFMAKMEAWPQVMVRVNMNPAPLIAGDDESIRREIERVLELSRGRQRVCIGTGVLPYEVDPGTVLRTRQMVLSSR